MPALSYKTRRRLALAVLLFWLPLYVAFAWYVVVSIGRPHIALEFLIYVALGVVWALPLKMVFLGVGQANPDAQQPPETEDHSPGPES